MVNFINFYSFFAMPFTLRNAVLAAVLCATPLLVSAAPLSASPAATLLGKRLGTPVHITIDTRPDDHMDKMDYGHCNRAQVELIQQGIREAKMLANAAWTRMYQHPQSLVSQGTDIRLTRPFLRFFGPSPPANTNTIAGYYAVVAGIADAVVRDAAIYGNLPDPTAISIECSVHFAGETEDFIADTTRTGATVIRLFPEAWQFNVNAATQQPSVYLDALWWAQQGISGNNGVFSLGYTLLHELFHAPILFGVNLLDDVASLQSYGLQQVQNLPQHQKLRNSQNYVWFAFVSYAKPAMFTNQCFDTAPLTHLSTKRAPPPPKPANQTPNQPGIGAAAAPPPNTPGNTPGANVPPGTGAGKPPVGNPARVVNPKVPLPGSNTNGRPSVPGGSLPGTNKPPVGNPANGMPASSGPNGPTSGGSPAPNAPRPGTSQPMPVGNETPTSGASCGPIVL